MPYSVSPRRKLQIGRVEPQLELQHADANALGGKEVAELVHEHEHAEHEEERCDGLQVTQHEDLRLSILPREQPR